jgi:hypothetical protein
VRATAAIPGLTIRCHAAVCLRSGVVSEPRALYSRLWSGLCWLEVSVTNGCLLAHAARPLVNASIDMAAQLAPSRGPCYGVVEAA